MSNEWSMSKWHLTLTHLYSYPTLMTWQVSYRFSSPSPLSTAWIFVQPFLSPRPGCFPDDLTKSFPKTGSIKHWGGVWEIQNPWAFGTPTFLVSSSFIQTCELDWIREYVGLFSKVPWSELSVFKSEICTKLKKMFFFGLVGVVNCFNAFQITGPPKKNSMMPFSWIPLPQTQQQNPGAPCSCHRSPWPCHLLSWRSCPIGVHLGPNVPASESDVKSGNVRSDHPPRPFSNWQWH